MTGSMWWSLYTDESERESSDLFYGDCCHTVDKLNRLLHLLQKKTIFHFLETWQGHPWLQGTCLPRMVSLSTAWSSRLWCWTWPWMFPHRVLMPSECVDFVIQFTFTREAALQGEGLQSDCDTSVCLKSILSCLLIPYCPCPVTD